MKHSVSVFFAKHGLESCWRLGVVEPEQSIVFYGLESCWRSGVVEPDQSIVFSGFQKSPAWGILSACFLLGMGSTHAGVRLFRNRSFVFYGFQRWRESFCLRVFCLAWARICLRVFCLAWARILLVFRSFRIWRWRDFERPSFGIHVAYGFSLGRGSTAAGVRVFRNRSFVFYYCFLWVPKVTWSILSACFLLGMGSNLAGVSVFSNLTLTRLCAAIVRNPRFERFFAWQRLDCCWRSDVSEPKLCFLCEAFCLRVFCLAWARILLVFWSFRLWRWRDFEQPSFGIHGVRVFRNVPEPDQSFFYLVFFYIFSGL